MTAEATDPLRVIASTLAQFDEFINLDDPRTGNPKDPDSKHQYYLRCAEIILTELKFSGHEFDPGWNELTRAPLTGEIIVGAELYRYQPYKPDGRRQMRALGRWQRWNGYGFENSEPPKNGWRDARKIQNIPKEK